MNASPWAPYEPSPSAPWNLARAWALRRRAGFGATWRELRRDLEGSPGAAVDRVLAGDCRMDGVPQDFAPTAEVLGDSAVSATDARRLQAWWLYRMMFTPDPLLERLTLMWHDHFATSQLKVDDVPAMRRQNETLRRLARKPFDILLREMLRDPALLAWLDAPTNRKGKPNENLARELMELFTLGIGHYAESDVKEVARAMTGRSVVGGRFQFRAEDHDDGEKTILGRTARFDGEAVVDHLLAQESVADRIAWRLCATFLGEGVVDASAGSELARRIRDDGLHVGRAVETILRSNLFFSGPNLHARVIDPPGFVVGTVRALERFDPPPSTLLLAEWTARMGQDLYFPPNVGGWPGGRGWMTGRSVLARSNFAAALTAGRLNVSASPPDLAALATRSGRGRVPSDSLAFFGELLTGRGLDEATREGIWQAAGAGGAAALNMSVALLLARPESQLG